MNAAASDVVFVLRTRQGLLRVFTTLDAARSRARTALFHTDIEIVEHVRPPGDYHDAPPDEMFAATIWYYRFGEFTERNLSLPFPRSSVSCQ